MGGTTTTSGFESPDGHCLRNCPSKKSHLNKPVRTVEAAVLALPRPDTGATADGVSTENVSECSGGQSMLFRKSYHRAEVAPVYRALCEGHALNKHVLPQKDLWNSTTVSQHMDQWVGTQQEKPHQEVCVYVCMRVNV